jgi:hypothetical protein
MLSARPEVARQIEDVAKLLRAKTAEGDGLVVFPEGEVLNFLAGRPNPIRHKLYLPGYLNRGKEPEVLAELERARPDAVVVWPRPLGEYGAAEFGVGYGEEIRRWIEKSYDELPLPAGGRAPVVALRRNP